jgi:cytochrome P450
VIAAVDLFDPSFHATGDPHAVWARLRATAPLHRQELPDGRAFWSVTRHRDVCRVLAEHRLFTSQRGSLLMQLGRGDAAAGRMLVATDPPRHAQLRRPLTRLFTGPALTAMTGLIREAARAVLAPGDDGPWDLARRAAELPMAVAGALMGIPAQDRPELVRWTGMAAAPTDPLFAVAGEGATLAIAHHELFEYFSGLARAKAGGGADADDLVGHLLSVHAGDGPLSHDEVVVNCYSILLGANATTPHTITGTVLALMEHPGQYRAAATDPSLVPGLVEEGLRWTSPASSFLRHATEDTELAGGRVRGGDPVVAWIGSANRDETVFPDPDRFDIGRVGNRHVAFGHGPHHCLGAAMARLTLRVFFEETLRLVEAFEPAGPPVRLVSNFVAGHTHLPVRTVPRSRTGR